jgi:1-phosphofructokinase family hexose kinase
MVIAGPNPTIDRMIGLDRFDPGFIHRADHVEARLGGGGVNAARVAIRVGARPTLITSLPSEDEPHLLDGLRAEGIEVEGIHVDGRTRIATILRERDGRTSVLHEPGAALDIPGWEAFAKLAVQSLAPGRVLLCSGSLPPGAPIDGYARLAREARHAGCRCVVDAAGETLAATIEAREGIVVPNLAEAEGLLFGTSAEAVLAGETPERAQEVASGLLGIGAHLAVVTAGSAGAAWSEGGRHGGSGWVDAQPVEAAHPVGAGDSFAAGFSHQLEERSTLGDAVAAGVATAAAYLSGSLSSYDAAA